MNRKRRVLWGIFFIILSILVILEQVWVYGHVFDFDQILHHEYFATIFFLIGVMILLSKAIARS